MVALIAKVIGTRFEIEQGNKDVPDHGQGSTEETGSNPLDRRESNSSLSQEGVEDEIENGNENLTGSKGKRMIARENTNRHVR
jgi:hypothetical protein